MDTVRNPQSSFRELRLAAGYKTVGALRKDLAARNIRLPTTTIYRLDRGGRPENWERLCLFADVFNISHAKAATKWWHETDGDPCPRDHGCNGVLRLPSDPKAEHLLVELTCETCPGTWTELISEYHPKRCQKCLAAPRSALDEMLKARGCTVADCAQAIGYPVKTVDGWAAGSHGPNLERLRRLCAWLEVPLEEAGASRPITGSGYTLFWKQTVGDHCPTHDWCRGVLTPPIDGKAQCLDIMILCKEPGCEEVKFYRGDSRYQHHDHQYCRDHGIKHRREPRKPGPAVLPKDPSLVVERKCGGYNPDPFAKRAPKRVHADTCPRETKTALRRLKFIKYRGPTGWISKVCLRAERGVLEREERLKDFSTAAKEAYSRSNNQEAKDYFAKTMGFESNKSVPKVKSKPQLDRWQKACHQLWSYIINTNDGGKLLRLFDEELQKLPRAQQMKERLRIDHLLGFVPIRDPKTRQRDQARKDALKRIPAEFRHVAGGLVMRWTPKSTGKTVPKRYWKLREGKTDLAKAQAQELLGGANFVAKKVDEEWMVCVLPSEIQGLCELCGELLIYPVPITAHPYCRRNPETQQDRGGHPIFPGNLPKFLSWAVCIKLRGQSFGDIAEEYKVARSTVQEGLESLKRVFPQKLEKVPVRYHKMVSLLRVVLG